MSAARIARRGERLAAIGPLPSRAGRFAARLRGEAAPRFDALAAVPLWRLHPDADLGRVALAAGLLHYRAQIDGELSGARLKPLVELCGEELFDRVCAAAPPPPEQRAAVPAIPDAEELLIVGRSFLDRPDDPGARALAQRALALVTR